MKILYVGGITLTVNFLAIMVIQYAGQPHPADLWNPVKDLENTRSDNQHEIGINVPPYKLSKAWDEYTKSLNIIEGSFRDENYWEQRAKFVHDNVARFQPDQLLKKDNRVIYTNYGPEIFETNQLSYLGNLFLQADAANEVFVSSIDQFFASSFVWHTTHEIGKDFLCDYQRYNNIPGSYHLTNDHAFAKLGAEYKTLYDWEHMNCYNELDFLPETYIMNDTNDCQAIIKILQEDDREIVRWIRRIPSSAYNVSQVNPLKTQNIDAILSDFDNGKRCGVLDAEYVITKFIENSAMVNGTRVLPRVTIIIASVDPLLVLYDDFFSTDLELYLSQYEDKEERIDNMRKQVMKNTVHLTLMIKDKLLKHPGVFEYFAHDYALDEDDNLYLIDITSNPSLAAPEYPNTEKSEEFMKNLVDMQSVLSIENYAVFDSIIDQSNLRWIYDERISGKGAYFDHVDEECVLKK